MPKIVDHDARRKELAAAVWRVVITNGISNLTIRLAAAEAGCSTGQLAHYFRTKAELLTFALQYAHDTAALRVQAAANSRSGIEALTAALSETLPLDAERRSEIQLDVNFWGCALGDEHLRAIQQREFDRWREDLLAIVGAIGNDLEEPAAIGAEMIVDTLLALVDGLGVESVLHPGRVSPSRTLEIMSMVVGLLWSSRGAARGETAGLPRAGERKPQTVAPQWSGPSRSGLAGPEAHGSDGRCPRPPRAPTHRFLPSRGQGTLAGLSRSRGEETDPGVAE